MFPIKNINIMLLICYRVTPHALPNNWKICIPSTLINHVIRWYNVVLGHPDATRLYNTIRTRFHAERLSSLCQEYWCPDNYHLYKQPGRGVGLLPPCQAQLTPCNKVCIDLIGPWTIVINGNICKFNALTCIDPVTNLVEIIQINEKTVHHVRDQFKNVWLSRYPKPNRCVHGNGNEFIAMEFQNLLYQFGIKM